MNLFKRLFCKNNENGFKYVDLGLPSGTMWATCNVGASRPEDSGLLFQFGRVDGYKYGDSNKFIKKNNIPTTTSGKTYKRNDILELEDDAAYIHMGGKWKMPTYDQLKELLDNTTYEVKTINGIKGVLFISNINGNQLFIPFAGCWYNGDFMAAGPRAYMWSSQVHPSDINYAFGICCNSSGSAYISRYRRSCAFSVRGVFIK